MTEWPIRLASAEDADHLPAIETAAGELFKTIEGLAVDATANVTSVTIGGRDVNAKVPFRRKSKSTRAPAGHG